MDLLQNNWSNKHITKMRTAPNNIKSNFVVGTAREIKQFIMTDLRWLAPPVAIWLISTCVLFITLWRPKSNDVPIWKSSSLVLLQCMLTNNELGWSREVEKDGEDSRVKLWQRGKGWQLVDTSTDLIESENLLIC
jgi:hypothetical protein